MVLVVDLDGTFIKNDLYIERLIQYFFRHTMGFFRCWKNSKGYVDFKRRVLSVYPINRTSIIINKVVENYILDNRHNYSSIILLSASPAFYVDMVANWTNLFDYSYGSISTNLKGIEKVKFLEKLGFMEFAYIGNSKEDIIIYSRAKIAFNFNGIKLCEILYN